MKIAVLSPHRDDAALSLGLAIESWLDAGYLVHVVNCFTRSEYAPYANIKPLIDNERLAYVAELRMREDENWRRNYKAGLTLTDLELKDAPIRLHCSAGQVCGMSVKLEDGVVATIQKGLMRAGADAQVLPLALGGHVDHLTARLAATTEKVTMQPCAFYEDLPYAARPNAASEIGNTAKSIDLDLVPMYAGKARNINEATRRKRRLALCYNSQIDDAVAGEIADFCARYGGRERLWANAAWRTSGLIAMGEDSQAAVC